MMKEEGSILENHIGTIVQASILGVLGWILLTVIGLRTEVGVLQARIASLEASVAQGTTDRYRGSDAARDLAAIWQEFDRREVRIKRLEEAFLSQRRNREQP